MAVQFTYMQQNPDGSVSTHGAIADRPPSFGELAEHVASTGATLVPATPAEQPPPAPREAAPPPPPPSAPPLPSDVQQTGGTGPTPVNPPRSAASYIIPASTATLGAWGLPAAAAALAGPLGWPAAAGLAIVGSGIAGTAGEYGQAQLERAMFGEPPPGSPTPWERATKFGQTAGETEAAVQVASPILGPVIRAALRPAGSTAVSAATSEAGPLLRTGSFGREAAAVEAGQEVVGQMATRIEGRHATDSIRVASAAPHVTIDTDPLAPLVQSTRDALVRQGATPEHLATFDRNMAPITQGGPQPLHEVLGAERNMNRWATNLGPDRILPELDALTTSTRNVIGAGVENTPAAAPFRAYLDTQAFTAPLRVSLREAANTAPQGFQPWLAGADGQGAMQAVIDHGSAQEVATLGKAWLASTRQAARTALDPAQYVADAYTALPPPWRTAMFGEATPALANLMGEATRAAPPGLKLPGLGTVQVARPWARGVLMSPTVGAGATNVLGNVASGAGRVGAYTGVAQTSEPKPPGSGP